MSRWRPCKRREFVRKLSCIGFDGPFSGTRHQFILFNDYRFAIPSNAEYSIHQVKFLLKEVEGIIERNISLKEWEQL